MLDQNFFLLLCFNSKLFNVNISYFIKFTKCFYIHKIIVVFKKKSFNIKKLYIYQGYPQKIILHIFIIIYFIICS